MCERERERARVCVCVCVCARVCVCDRERKSERERDRKESERAREREKESQEERKRKGISKRARDRPVEVVELVSERPDLLEDERVLHLRLDPRGHRRCCLTHPRDVVRLPFIGGGRLDLLWKRN